MKSLINQAERVKTWNLKAEQSTTRTQAMTHQCGPWRVDLSKQFLDDEVRDNLMAWCEARGLEQAIDAMFAGAPLNHTEGRAVLHTALRGEAADPFAVDGASVMPDVLAERQRCFAFAEAVRSGAHTGVTGERIERVVNIGIGGSDLGPRMAVAALAADHDGPDVRFVANVDPADLQHALSGANPARTLFIVASKTFTTIETLTNARVARQWLVDALGERAVSAHFVALSTAADKVEAFGIGAEQTFGFWDWVGGRYSLWSAIGLPIMIAIGEKNFEAFLSGARAVDQHFKSTPMAKNVPVLLGALHAWYRSYCGFSSHAVIPYDQNLFELASYLQQADMESLGKSVDRDGNFVDHATGAVVWGEPGTNGQHAFFQLLHQGTDRIPVDFVVPIKAREGSQAQRNILIANALAQTQALLQGKETAQARLEKTGPDGVDLGPHRTFSGNRPSTLFLTEALTPHALGALIALHEHRIFVQGWLWNLNAYDQWGVELGKELALKASEALESGDTSGQDASTAEALRYVRNVLG